MHYRNGEEAKVGHVVKGTTPGGSTIIGTVLVTHPGATTCNLGVAPALQVTVADGATIVAPVTYLGTPWTLTAGECERVA